MESKDLDDTVHMQDDLTLHILCIFESTFSFDTASIHINPLMPSVPLKGNCRQCTSRSDATECGI